MDREWNSGTVEWWNSGMAGWSIDDSLGHNKLISCFLDRIEVRTGSVGRQKNKNNNCTVGRVTTFTRKTRVFKNAKLALRAVYSACTCVFISFFASWMVQKYSRRIQET